MALLVAGLVLFLGIHLVPAVPALRASLVARFGERGYKGAFSALSAVGLVVVAIGFGSARGGPVLFAPVPEAVALAPYAMAASFALFAAANLRGHLRRAVRHPMLAGTILWAGVHLAANGDRASTVLFGAFLAWALVDLASAIARRAVRPFEPNVAHDVIAVVAGIGAMLAFATLHRVLFGVQVVPFGL
ncbi:MAG: NnrU family protein [Burkholderiales bacterium]|jgi:uncharacterized membrane protein|nr:NnrU family protein [Burkholderiales bacterium]